MRSLRADTAVIVWLVLVLATFLSWELASEEARAGDVIAVAILMVAAAKVRLVGLHFMQLRDAPGLLRGMFELYVVALFVALVGLFLAA